MLRHIVFAVLAVSASGVLAQSSTTRPKFDAFEVATVKPADFDPRGGRYMKMEGNNRFIEKAYTLKLLIAAAYDLNARAIAGGPSWMESQHYDIVAVTPGATRPDHDEQMSMLRSLLRERFQLTFHREEKVFSMYVLEVAKNGPRLKPTAAQPDDPVVVGPAVVYPEHVVLPGRNASMDSFVSLLQRAVLDRPVVNKTGLSGSYDFDLDWAPDETQFGGDLPPSTEKSTSPPLFEAMPQQLGLQLEAMRGSVQAMVIDTVAKPEAN